MPTNVYFDNFNNQQEQALYDDLIIETIQMYGHDVKYIPRVLGSFDEIYTEDDTSSFVNAIDIEMYIKSVDGFSGDGVFLSKYGLEIRDEVVFTVAKTRFEKQVTNTDLTRNVPKEGDIVYFPLNKKPFQIKYVDKKPFFYQFGTLMTYDLVCELFEYSNETFATGNTEIDEIQTKNDLNVLIDALLTEDGEYLLTENGDYLVMGDVDTTTQDPGSDNIPFHDEATSNNIFDWTELDPFSEGMYE